MQPLELGGRFIVKKKLGQGGGGAVYLTEHKYTKQAWVVKELLDTFTDNVARQEAYADFEREAQVLGQLKQNNPDLAIPQVYDIFLDGQPPSQKYYLVMEYVQGENLAKRIQGTGKFSEAETLQVARAVADICVVLHSQQPDPIVHRDIKPDNLIIDTNNRLILVDFGLAKPLTSGSPRRATVAGSLGYTPIEQWESRAQPSSDVYALGATLYHLLTGQYPDVTCGLPGNIFDLYKIDPSLFINCLQQYQHFPTLAPAVSAELERLIMEMLEDDENHRPPMDQVQQRIIKMQAAPTLQSPAPTYTAQTGSPVVAKVPPPTIRCTSCGKMTPADRGYCQYGPHPLHGTKQCPQCGRAVPVAKFCTKCGGRL